MKSTAEDEFLNGLLDLQYDAADLSSLKEIAQAVPWAAGWPQDERAFWNAEAFMWSRKIEKKVRMLIKEELAFLGAGLNLDLGCGAYSYISSVGFDLSEKMLAFNENCLKKVQGNVEEGLPFADGSFDSVTAIFLLNYVHNYLQLFREVRRVLSENGVFVMVLSAKPINEWQRQKEVNSFNQEKWFTILGEVGFKVEMRQKEELFFYTCVKSNCLASGQAVCPSGNLSSVFKADPQHQEKK